MKPQRLLVFSDDWGRHPSSCQHLVKQLLPNTEVCWVNTIGTRKPSFDLYSLRRGLEKLAGWSSAAPPKANDNPQVVAPMMWPSFASTFGRDFNRRSLLRMFQSVAPGGGWTALTTLPLVADLVEPSREAGVDRWIYYAVDDLAQWPQLDRKTLEPMEEQLVQSVDAVVVVSEELQRRMQERGIECEVITHGVDLDFWTGSAGSKLELEQCQRPIVCFWGVLDRRLASSWLSHLSERLERGTILLVGPHNNPDPEVLELPGVVAVGAQPYEALPAVAREASVLLMPYADLPVTRAMQPLKLKEYLATGLPAVCAELPAVTPWSDCCDVVSDPVAFGDRVLERLRTGLPEQQKLARARLADESWQSKAERLRTRLFEDPAPKLPVHLPEDEA